MAVTDKWAGPVANSSSPCGHNLTNWEQSIEKMYTYFYLLVFIPGLLLNATALWVLCRHIRKNTKAAIFMINLALADLVHILSLPLRIYYYFTHVWPFGQGVCLFCFYLKYLNMYAAIAFLVCISIQRCVFLLRPFAARQWRRRYDLLISITVWVVVSLGCSPFILMRSSSPSPSSVTQADYNMSFSLEVTSNQQLIGSARPVSPSPHGSGLPTQFSCFKDLPMRRLPVSLAVTMMVFAELLGFVIPFACISYSSFLIVRSLKQGQTCDEHSSSSISRRSRPPSLSIQSDSFRGKQTNAEKQRALKMVLSCSALFLVCFAPYHINFLFYLMVSQGVVSHCATELAVRRFHPLSLCLASLSCCLNPLLYYFLNAEFRLHLSRRASSSVFSSLNSPTQRLSPRRLLSTESNCSDRQWPPSPTED
uniref:P2Y receptor family member 10 n=2 Tax=Takifugu rubripes TaxID=31033 RepID=A0A3B5K153_TAKRU